MPRCCGSAPANRSPSAPTPASRACTSACAARARARSDAARSWRTSRISRRSGARPLGCLLALAAPPTLLVRTLDALVAGLLDEAARYACPLVGGNLSRASELSLTLTVIGAVARGRELRRGAARAGDRVFVTGTLGGAALERARAERGRGRIRHVPVPRLRAGRALSALSRRVRVACIDVSDGLDADLAHLLAGRALGGRDRCRPAARPARLPGGLRARRTRPRGPRPRRRRGL